MRGSEFRRGLTKLQGVSVADLTDIDLIGEASEGISCTHIFLARLADVDRWSHPHDNGENGNVLARKVSHF